MRASIYKTSAERNTWSDDDSAGMFVAHNRNQKGSHVSGDAENTLFKTDSNSDAVNVLKTGDVCLSRIALLESALESQSDRSWDQSPLLVNQRKAGKRW